jgi:hypothetical protein
MEIYRITGRQIAAGRTLVNLGQAALAEAARISVPTLARMEASQGPASGFANNVEAVKTALEKAGVEFLAEDDGGPGVRLRKAKAKRKTRWQKERTKGFFVSFDYTSDAMTEIGRFFRQTGKVIVPFTVTEILNEQIAQKLA